MPPFLMGLLLIYVFAFLWPVFPVSGYGGLSHLVLPAFTVGLTGGAYYARLLRGQLVEVMDADFIRASRSRGLSERSIFIRHTMRNSILVVVTWIGMDLGYFLSGIIAVEAIFAWPGNWQFGLPSHLDLRHANDPGHGAGFVGRYRNDELDHRSALSTA